MLWACDTAAPIDGRRGPNELTLAAGVEVRLVCGVNCGVGNMGGRGIDGSDDDDEFSIRRFGSRVINTFRRKAGTCS